MQPTLSFGGNILYGTTMLLSPVNVGGGEGVENDEIDENRE